MTAREIIKEFQDLGEEYLDLPVAYYDEYRYCEVVGMEITETTGISSYDNIKEEKIIELI